MGARVLDKRIAFDARSRTVDGVYGAVESEGWSEVCTVWASVWPVLPSRAERMGETLSTSRKLYDIEVRWGAPIDGRMRVRYGSETMQIVSGPTEKGRQDRLVLMCEALSTEGVAP